jgi:hypothetical protein
MMAWLSPNSRLEFAGLLHYKISFASALERRNKISGFGIFRGGGPIGELQVVDRRFLREELGLVETRFRTQSTGGLPATIERCARSVEIAAINKLEGPLADHGELRPVTTQPGKLLSQRDELVSRGVKPRRDFMRWDTDLAELGEHPLQWGYLNTLVARDLFGQRRQLRHRRLLRFADKASSFFLIKSLFNCGVATFLSVVSAMSSVISGSRSLLRQR